MEVETILGQDNVVKENCCLNIKEINKKKSKVKQKVIKPRDSFKVFKLMFFFYFNRCIALTSASNDSRIFRVLLQFCLCILINTFCSFKNKLIKMKKKQLVYFRVIKHIIWATKQIAIQCVRWFVKNSASICISK